MFLMYPFTVRKIKLFYKMTTHKGISKFDFISSAILVVLLFILLIFHFLVVTGVIPFEIIWGGKLENYAQMLVYESVSIGINLVIILVVCVNAGFIKFTVNRILVRVSLWVIFFLFLLNTLGNFTSQNQFERIVFGPLTLVLSFLCLKLSVSGSRNFRKDV